MNTENDYRLNTFPVVAFLLIVIFSVASVVFFCIYGVENNVGILDSSLDIVAMLMIATLSTVLLFYRYDARHMNALGLLMLNLVCLLSLDISYCASAEQMTSSHATVIWSIDSLLCYLAYYSSAYLFLTVYDIGKVGNNYRKILIVGVGLCVIYTLLNPFVDTIGHVEGGTMHYSIGAYFSLILVFIPVVVSFDILQKNRGRNPAEKLFRIYLAIVLLGMILQFISDLVYFSLVMISYGFIFLFSAKLINRKHMVSDNLHDNADVEFLSLSSQLTPHFLFNSLSSIMNLPSNNERSRVVLADFSAVLRYAIDNTDVICPVTISEELDQTESYVNVMKLQYGDRLDYVTDVPDGKILVPPLTLKSLISQVLRPYTGVAEFQTHISVKSKKLSGKSRIIFEAKACISGAGQPADITFDPMRMSLVEGRVKEMVGGTMPYIYSKDGEAVVIIDIPEVSHGH